MRIRRFQHVAAFFILCIFAAITAPAQNNRVLEFGTPASVGIDGARLAEGVNPYREAVNRYRNAEILTPESIRKATTSRAKVNERTQYGFGWMISAEGVLSHSGSDGTMAWVDAARDVIGMVLTQSPGGRNPVQQFQNLVAESCIGK